MKKKRFNHVQLSDEVFEILTRPDVEAALDAIKVVDNRKHKTLDESIASCEREIKKLRIYLKKYKRVA